MVNQGEKAPNFTLADTDRKPRSLSEFLKPNGATLLAFFPGAFTTVCTREMCTLRDNIQELNKVNAQVVGISVNDPFTNKAFAQNNNLNFPILSDYNREVVKLYNVFHEDFGNLKGYTVAKRSVFILDRNGVVVYKWVSDDPTKEPNYEELKKAAAKTT
ncbi:MAG: peroxiredoxin [Crenarchaeota archaeon 13_1_40CM_2_52_14]|nr:MAG: peroxiredoxin [Crenarchaeota archaeon 13_1_40CM_3_52_17]OLD34543.1 MAG: peroxiredoxin [Crenarchaeota archaeon 13_1_40CM_2_52_14]OLE69094.1 MAG: peroxiredoxin [archaeon 13_1_20CM_2_51_12]